MNRARWHLVVNHFPIIFPIVGVIAMVAGLISKSDAIARTAFMIFIFGALTTIAAMTTGGKIRHTEIRSRNNVPASENNNAEQGD